MNSQRLRRFLAALGAVGALSCAAHAQDDLIWIEGESAAQKTVFDNAGLNAVDTTELSGGAWLSSFSEPNTPVGTATYNVTVPQTGSYNFWVRSNPSGSGLLYRVDGGDWKTVDLKAIEEAQKGGKPRLVDYRQASVSGEPGFIVLQWVNVGALELAQGAHQIEFSLGGTGEGARYNAIDCFVLTRGEFSPNAKFKPGENWTNLISFKPGETWDFSPPTDTFDVKALLDLRSLNEKVAGESGFIKRSADGMDFLRGDNQPIRFWGGSDYTQRDLDVDGVAKHGRFLAKRGVNIVRWHGDLAIEKWKADSMNPKPSLTDVDEKELDEAFKLVAGMKRAGIYTILSPYWGSHSDAHPSWNIDGNQNLSGLVFFHPTVQQAYKLYLRALYTRKNPYTGVALKDEPAVAIIQLQNEDSMLFYTMQGVRGEPLRLLRQQYGAWVKKKYGSFEKARTAWKNYKHDDDNFANSLPGMFIVWEFGKQARDMRGKIDGREERLSDQLEFMAQTQYNFNAEMKRFLRDELGCKQLINAGNWRTVDQALVDDAERWSYTANEVIGKNHYYGGHHRGINEGWQILPGHVFSSPSATLDPVPLPINVRQVQGRPFIIPESLWVHPTKYESEGPLMVAAQTSMTGVDTFYWFANGVPEWQSPGVKWTYATPMQLGQFPAAALLYRMGYLKRATQPVVLEQKPLPAIWARQEPLIAEERAYDPNRDTGGKTVGNVQSAVDPLAFMAGPVVVNYGGDPKKTRVSDLSKHIDRQAKTVKSVTGEITTDMARGLYKVDAPRAQAVTGFLGRAGTVTLKNAFVRVENEYASVALVPLDGKPLATSGKVLLQIGTVARPTGWVERPMKFQADGKTLDGFRLVDAGRGPWQIERTRGVVTVSNRNLTRAVILDANGVAQGEAKTEKRNGSLRVTLPPDALYVVLQ